MALPLYVPFAYITFLVGLLWLFSRHYRSRALRRKAPPPWFNEPHTARDVYISLLSMDPPPPQPVLVAALIARAMTGVKRIISLKEAKQSMMKLLQKGQVGDELWERLLLAEKELELELSEVVSEANEFSQGWGSVIFDVSSEASQAFMCQEIYRGIPKQRSIKAQEIEAARVFAANPGELKLVGSKPAIPAAKPASQQLQQQPISAAKQAMLDAIKAAQAKQLEAEQKKEQQQQQQQQKTSSNSNSNTKSLNGSSPELGGDDNEGSENNSVGVGGIGSTPSKKKKPKKKKK